MPILRAILMPILMTVGTLIRPVILTRIVRTIMRALRRALARGAGLTGGGHAGRGGAGAVTQRIAWARPFAMRPFRRTRARRFGPRRLVGTLGGALALYRLGLDLAHRFLEREAFAGDIGLAQRRLDAAQLRDQRGARPLIQRAAAFP
jgi:hypothetical protein